METMRRLSARDSGSSTGLSTPAIIGIACGSAAAALFLLSIVLFIIYWRLQRRYDVEDLRLRQRSRWTQEWDEWEGPWAEPAAPATPQYTMDYKSSIDRTDSRGTGTTLRGGASYSAETQHARGIGGMASSMPTHPAYIPKALVRGAASSTRQGSVRSSPDEVQLAPLAPSYQSRPRQGDYAVQSSPNTAEATYRETPQLLPLPQRKQRSVEPSPTASTATSTLAPSTTATSIPSRAGSEPPGSAVASTQPRRPSADTSPSSVSARRQTRQSHRRRNRSRSQSQSASQERPRSPTGTQWVSSQTRHNAQGQKVLQVRNDQPLAGHTDITISGPLAFADSNNGNDWRTFRERSQSNHQRLSTRYQSSPRESHKPHEQALGRDPPRREITIESDDSDLFG